MSERQAAVTIRRGRGPLRAVVLVLHGGAEHGRATVHPWRLAYLRMVPIAKSLHRATARHGVEVRLLRNRVRGWNAPGLDAVRDARWALDGIRAEHPGVPVVLVGHSMGGRVALRVADDPAVAGVCALAPWTPAGEPVAAVRDRAVLIAHGTKDLITSPADSYTFGSRAETVASRIARFEVSDEGHAMLRRSPVWTRLVCAFTLDTLGLPPSDGMLTGMWTRPIAERLRIPL
ncbi:alpha/beta hydrolase [Amycolatopsis sp. YIM 10]|uniref:alpha/beta hydrolase n=1 Tax=Amycolatopsis sp. YIM 10 TaxID=2653857 RepID=UPI0012900DC1|nr:alpha/beta fold hydrolase [Amycolatopsis sp. YIM 10]QFU88837.1 Alpha/beta hydrolase family protein [Amycolatopsis sp. YIM 10]